jgi:hypothetical protein
MQGWTIILRPFIAPSALESTCTSEVQVDSRATPLKNRDESSVSERLATKDHPHAHEVQ